MYDIGIIGAGIIGASVALRAKPLQAEDSLA